MPWRGAMRTGSNSMRFLDRCDMRGTGRVHQPADGEFGLGRITMKRTPAIPFAGAQLNETRHVCAFFNSNDEAYRVLLPFIKDGIDCGDKAVHVVNPDQHEN